MIRDVYTGFLYIQFFSIPDPNPFFYPESESVFFIPDPGSGTLCALCNCAWMEIRDMLQYYLYGFTYLLNMVWTGKKHKERVHARLETAVE